MVFLVLAAEIACLLVIVVLLVRGFRKRGHVVAVALAALLMGLVPSVSDGEWVRGIGQGLSFALLTVLGGVAFGSPGDHPVLTSRGSMTAGVSALLLSLAAATLWTFLPEGKLWLGVPALVAAGALSALVLVPRRSA
jgi:hypothetical protein